MAGLRGVFPWSHDADDAVGLPPSATSSVDALTTPGPHSTPTTPPDAVFTLVAGGDILMHDPVVSDARTSDGGYDFTPLFAPVEPWIAGADLALCHLEVPIAPTGEAPSGYPMFGAPQQVAPALAAAGWDGCSTASNHSLDRGERGVRATLDALDAVGLGHVGTARSPEEAARPQTYTLFRGQEYLRIAHIAATYGTNGLPIPADSPWLVSTIDSAALIAQATAARTAGADIVVASIHCCVEYVSAPTQDQVKIASDLAASGVIDLVIGHHAHVPQSIALLPGGPNGNGMWVAYGLGNFVSNQDAACCVAATDSGLLLTATFTKPYGGPPAVTRMEWSGITVDRSGGHRVLPLSAAVAAGADSGRVRATDLITRLQRVVDVVGTEASERTEPPVATGTPPIVADW